MESSNHTPELWEISGSHWTLPVMVEIVSDTARVTIPAIPLLLKQTAILNNCLNQLATGGTETERVIPVAVLIEYAKKSEQPDAESVVVWNRVPATDINVPDQEDVDEFVADWLTASGFSINKASATALFISICTHMMHWLVNRRRPVNLMFGVIEPFQYRRNWKEILLGMTWEKAQKGTLEDRTIYMASHQPTESDLVQSELIGVEKDLCAWTLEFAASEWFTKQSIEVERNRRRRMGSKAYLVSVCRTLMSHAERAAMAYRRFVNEQNQKIVALPEFHQTDGGYLGTVKKQTLFQSHRPYRAFVLPADLVAATKSSGPENAETPT